MLSPAVLKGSGDLRGEFVSRFAFRVSRSVFRVPRFASGLQNSAAFFNLVNAKR
jgi:hypothetical protein